MLYLASASPRRRALLEQAGVPFVVVRSDVQEHFQKGIDVYKRQAGDEKHYPIYQGKAGAKSECRKE